MGGYVSGWAYQLLGKRLVWCELEVIWLVCLSAGSHVGLHFFDDHGLQQLVETAPYFPAPPLTQFTCSSPPRQICRATVAEKITRPVIRSWCRARCSSRSGTLCIPCKHWQAPAFSMQLLHTNCITHTSAISIPRDRTASSHAKAFSSEDYKVTRGGDTPSLNATANAVAGHQIKHLTGDLPEPWVVS